jgi:hypothetical protein
MIKISTFDDWVDYFHEWQKDIGYDAALLSDYKFETKLGELHSPEIEFGDFKGQPKWQRVGQIPNQSIRDALMNLIVYQGDTEFASVEQQKNLLGTAPTEYDRKRSLRSTARNAPWLADVLPAGELLWRFRQAKRANCSSAAPSGAPAARLSTRR